MADSTLQALDDAALSGVVQKVTIYRTETGAWDCTVLAVRGSPKAFGHGLTRTPSSALRVALADLLAPLQVSQAVFE